MSIISDAEVAALAKQPKTETKPETEAKELPDVNEEVEQKSAASETLAEIGDESDPLHEKDETENSEEKESEKSARPKKKGLEKRIDKLVKDRSQARLDAEYWRAEALKKQSDTRVEKPVESFKAADDKPKADDFTEHADFIEALTDWKLAQRDMKQRETDLRTQAQKAVESYVEKKNAFVKDHDDFDEVVESVSDIPMSLTVREVLLEDGGKPELAYELAKDPEEYKRICSLSPLAAARAIGRIEARLSASDEKPETKKITKAPKPITPVGTKAKTERSIYDPSLSQREFEKVREAEIKQRLRN